MDEFLNEDGFADACASEEPYFAALAVRFEQVDCLDARFEDFDRRIEFGKSGRGAVYPHTVGGRVDVLSAVYGSSEHVEHSAEGTLADGDFYALARRRDAHSARKPFAFGQHYAAHDVCVQMLRNLHNLGVAALADGKRVAQMRQRFVEHHVDDGTRNSGDYAFFHCFAPLRFIDFAPEVTSVISCVMAAWRSRLNSSESSARISSALLSAPSIASIRAFCSQQ